MVVPAEAIVAKVSGVRGAPQTRHDVALSAWSAEHVGQVTISRAAL
jgi:hypothetical protein